MHWSGAGSMLLPDMEKDIDLQIITEALRILEARERLTRLLKKSETFPQTLGEMPFEKLTPAENLNVSLAELDAIDIELKRQRVAAAMSETQDAMRDLQEDPRYGNSFASPSLN